MRKNLTAMIFAAGLIGSVSGQAIGYAIWRHSPPTVVEVLVRESHQATVQNAEISEASLREAEAWCNDVQTWIATAEKLN